jgi:hypothetical protein
VITYLSGVTNVQLERDAKRHGIGLLVQPGNSLHRRLPHYPMWAADNGAFTSRGAFDPVRFRALLVQPALREHADKCWFVVAPDVLVVRPNGLVRVDAVATLKQFPEWAAEIRAAGLPVALVAQNGLERMLDDVPWELVDTLFIGGSTEWKTGQAARRCVAAAQALGKRTHMGRVNSYKRLTIAQRWGVDSADGTYLKFAPDTNLPRLLGWLDRASKVRQTEMQV